VRSAGVNLASRVACCFAHFARSVVVISRITRAPDETCSRMISSFASRAAAALSRCIIAFQRIILLLAARIGRSADLNDAGKEKSTRSRGVPYALHVLAIEVPPGGPVAARARRNRTLRTCGRSLWAGSRRSGGLPLSGSRNTRVATHPRPIAADYLIHERRTALRPGAGSGRAAQDLHEPRRPVRGFDWVFWIDTCSPLWEQWWELEGYITESPPSVRDVAKVTRRSRSASRGQRNRRPGLPKSLGARRGGAEFPRLRAPGRCGGHLQVPGVLSLPLPPTGRCALEATALPGRRLSPKGQRHLAWGIEDECVRGRELGSSCPKSERRCASSSATEGSPSRAHLRRAKCPPRSCWR
jgi:hypothetical protein